MPRYSYYNIIIIVTNVIILELFYAIFKHPGALLLLYFFQFELEDPNRKYPNLCAP